MHQEPLTTAITLSRHFHKDSITRPIDYRDRIALSTSTIYKVSPPPRASDYLLLAPRFFTSRVSRAFYLSTAATIEFHGTRLIIIFLPPSVREVVFGRALREFVGHAMIIGRGFTWRRARLGQCTYIRVGRIWRCAGVGCQSVFRIFSRIIISSFRNFPATKCPDELSGYWVIVSVLVTDMDIHIRARTHCEMAVSLMKFKSPK